MEDVIVAVNDDENTIVVVNDDDEDVIVAKPTIKEGLQQQHLIQMQPMMTAYYNNNVTTDHIQQFLDENKSLILKIVESQNAGKMSECAENQARLQRNLMYLAAIADSQPQPPSMLSQYAGGGMMQPGAHYLQNQQQQQVQQLNQQSFMAARSSMLYSQQPYAALQQQQMHNQFGLSSAGSSSLHMLQGEGHSGGSTAGYGGMGFPDLASRSGSGERGMSSGLKQDMGGSSSGGHGGESSEHLYLKTGDDGN